MAVLLSYRLSMSFRRRIFQLLQKRRRSATGLLSAHLRNQSGRLQRMLALMAPSLLIHARKRRRALGLMLMQ